MPPVVKKICITGGPCAGKTTALAHIKERVIALGFDVLIVPEAATLLLGGGYSYNREDVNDTANFQTHLLQVQLALEEAFEARAWQSQKKTLIVCDRGACDGRAFCSLEAWTIVERTLGLTTTELRDKRYDAVIHLETAAISSSELYKQHLDSNPVRVEKNPNYAIQMDNRLKTAWTGCPRLRVIPATPDFQSKLKRILDVISGVIGVPLPLEIERKFLVKSVSEIPVHSEEVEIIQNYLQPHYNGTEGQV